VGLAGPSRDRTSRAEPPGTDSRRPGQAHPLILCTVNDAKNQMQAE